MKKRTLFVIAMALLPAVCLIVPCSTTGAIELDAQQMAQITGGYKHCDDEVCADYAEGCQNGTMVVAAAGNGRRCWGTPATYCASSGETLCATYFSGCNADCSVCETSDECMTDSGCYSCN